MLILLVHCGCIAARYVQCVHATWCSSHSRKHFPQITQQLLLQLNAALTPTGPLCGLPVTPASGGTGCCRYAGKFEATPQQFATVLGQMTGLQELGLRGFELLPELPVMNGNGLSANHGLATVMEAIGNL